MMLTPAIIKDARKEKIRRDPGYFIEEVLGATVFPQQREMANAVKDSRRVSVVGANGTGKDFMAARLILWWMESRYPAKCVVTGPTTRQVQDIVWNEIRNAYANAPELAHYRVFETPRLALDQQHFAIGFATNRPYNLQGYHSPNLLVVITEAHAVEQRHIDALRTLQPRCVLMTGNPFADSGEFYDSHHTSRELYQTINISAFDTPNLADDAPHDGLSQFPGMVTKADIEARAAEWGEDSMLYKRGVLGQFAGDLGTVFVALFLAQEATRRSNQVQDSARLILACDVAREGPDKTVVTLRRGNVATIVWKAQGKGTDEVADWLLLYCREHNIPDLVIDDTGVGAGVTDELNRQRQLGRLTTRIHAFKDGSNAQSKDRFYNRGAEVWWRMGQWFLRDDPQIDHDNALISQISGRKVMQDPRGRLQAEPKKNLTKSPDEADSLAMTFALPEASAMLPDLGYRDNPWAIGDAEPGYADGEESSGLTFEDGGEGDGSSRWSI